jgi:quercetin dioxygenase-like cupin family protein
MKERKTMNNHSINLIAPHAGVTYLVLNDLVTIKVPGRETDRAYTVYEVTVPPGGGPPGIHQHPPQETFYILEGEFEFAGITNSALERQVATTGAVVHIPSGAAHGFKNVGAATGRLLAIASPAGHEEFAAELGLRVTDRNHLPQLVNPLDMAYIRAIVAKYGIERVRLPEEEETAR